MRFFSLLGYLPLLMLLGLTHARAESLGRVAILADESSFFADELERELRASSFEVIRLPHSEAMERNPEEKRRALLKQGLTEGVRLSQRGTQAELFFLDQGILQSYGKYTVHPQDRIARRRLWIWLGEELRARLSPAPPSQVETKTLSRVEVAQNSPSADPLQEVEKNPDLRPFSFGAASVLGYGSKNSFLGSHILLTGSTLIQRPIFAFANILWPLLSATEKSNIIVRSWTFQLQLGLGTYLASAHSPLRPYLGLGIGAQLLIAESENTTGVGGTTKTGSAILLGQVGTRIALTDRVALFLQIETGPAKPFAGTLDTEEAYPADAWFRRFGLGLVFNR